MLFNLWIFTAIITLRNKEVFSPIYNFGIFVAEKYLLKTWFLLFISILTVHLEIPTFQILLKSLARFIRYVFVRQKIFIMSSLHFEFVIYAKNTEWLLKKEWRSCEKNSSAHYKSITMVVIHLQKHNFTLSRIGIFFIIWIWIKILYGYFQKTQYAFSKIWCDHKCWKYIIIQSLILQKLSADFWSRMM